jgi:hypothetical protein
VLSLLLLVLALLLQLGQLLLASALIPLLDHLVLVWFSVVWKIDLGWLY